MNIISGSKFRKISTKNISYTYNVFENILFGISTLDYLTQPLKGSCHDHFEICLVYKACKQQYILVMLLTISNSKSAYLITPYSRRSQVVRSFLQFVVFILC